MTVRSLLLISCSALLVAGPGQAQTSYSTGSASYSQPSSATYQRGDAALPDLSPERIAADVVMEFNPRTGARERVAPTFDPFEVDDRMAGSVNLRSTDIAYDLDNRLLQDGVLLEIDLYYNDEGDRDFGRMRDAVFLNGEPVPVIRRDSRELECSSRVTETIYSHDRYYSGGYGGLFRPRPRYVGHFGYDRFWGGYSYHGGGSNRGYRPRARAGSHGYRGWSGGYRDRVHRPGYGRHPGQGYRGDRYRDGRGGGRDAVSPPRRNPPTGTSRFRPEEIGLAGGAHGDPTRVRVGPERRIPRVERQRRTPDRPGTDRRPRRDNADLPRVRRDRVPNADQTVRNPDFRQPPGGTTRRAAPRVDPRPQRRVEPRPQPRAEPRAEPRVQPRPQPRATQPVRPKPRPKPRLAPTERVERNMVPHRREGRKRLELFPGNGYAASSVVRTEWDCAREDQLVLFIPNARLDAARFDGLTLMLRDTTFDPALGQTTVYDERPLYVPPNYIEGFQIAKRQG